MYMYLLIRALLISSLALALTTIPVLSQTDEAQVTDFEVTPVEETELPSVTATEAAVTEVPAAEVTEAPLPVVTEVPAPEATIPSWLANDKDEYSATAKDEEDMETLGPLTAEILEGIDQANHCLKGDVQFNPLIHRKEYHVAIHSTRGVNVSMAAYGKVFGDYLTASAGQRFDPPVNFKVSAMTSWDIQTAADDKQFDFLYANSGWYSCMGLDYGADPLATTVSRQVVRGRSFDLDVYGGTYPSMSYSYRILFAETKICLIIEILSMQTFILPCI